MTLTLPKDIRNVLLKALASELAGHGYANGLAALNFLREVQSDLAQDEDIRKLVLQYLNCNALGYRQAAARLLHAVGDPLGVLHLVYNSLSIHPAMRIDQTMVSNWSDTYLIRCASSMSDECVDLLIEDICSRGYLHADALAAGPSEKIIPRMLELLERPIHIAAQAAYVLALKRDDTGRGLLEHIAEDMDIRFVELAIIGLSHIPDFHAIELIKGYAEPGHPIYHQDVPRFRWAWLGEQELQNKARQRVPLLEGVPFIEIAGTSYKRSIREEIEAQGVQLSEDFMPCLFVDQYDVTTSAPDFIAEFASLADREILSAFQKDAMRHLTDVVPLDILAKGQWSRFLLWNKRPRDSRNFITPGSYYPEGVRVLNDVEDYLFAATDWLMNPEEYRQGSHRRLPIALEQA